MKKIITLILALMMMFTLGACGGGAETTDATMSSEDVVAAELAAELETLKDSANALGAIYNELLPIADTNGWLTDDLFTQEANATAAIVQVAGEIVADPTMLEGESAQDMIDALDEMAVEWDTNIRAKVSEAYVAQ